RVDQQRATVDEIRQNLVKYRQENNRISLDHTENIEQQELFQLNQRLTTAKSDYDILKNRWELVEEHINEDKPAWDLPFIADDPRVSGLLKDISGLEVSLSSLRKRFGPKWPELLEAVKAYEQTQEELEEATDSAVQQTRVRFVESQRNFEQAQRRLAEKERENIELESVSVGYKALIDDLSVNQSILSDMVHRLEQEKVKMTLVLPNARIVERPLLPVDPARPNVAMNLTIGAFGGIFAGLALVFITAFLDDRIKTAFDIETAVGLPLVGIIPRIKRLNSLEKARAVAANADRRVTEAFRAIHSALKINETSRTAKMIVTTSTSPSEGKSFVTTNLALTFAIHGEKTLIVDGDLRMPNVAKSLEIPDTKGIIHVFDNETTLDDAIINELYPNLDVLTAGGKAKNPTQILNSPRYEQMMHELRSRYDRILIDSPPIGAVSDVLTILPHADGIIYVIKFNAVKRKTAKSNLRRIVESNTPVFGAILNQISVAVASYYYANYYDKSYQDYYTSNEEEGDLLEAQRKEPVSGEAPTEEVVTTSGEDDPKDAPKA
ncbi:MAG: polysaccharide biosynthesis tyrosine autokinase, partial [Verrucomicrobiota bacterium]